MYWFLGVSHEILSIVSLKQNFFVTLGNVFSDAGLINCGKDKDKDVEKIEKVLNKEFSLLCAWFTGNKLSIRFEDDKTKTTFFSRMENPSKVSISMEITL